MCVSPQEALTYMSENNMAVSLAAMMNNDFAPHAIFSSSHEDFTPEEDWAFELSTTEHKHGEGWKDKSVATREYIGMPLAFQPWTGHPHYTDVTQCGFTERDIDVVNVAFYKYCIKVTESEAAARSSGEVSPEVRSRWPEWWVDVSQDVSRCGGTKAPPSIHTHSCLYTFKYNRVFKGQDSGVFCF